MAAGITNPLVTRGARRKRTPGRRSGQTTTKQGQSLAQVKQLLAKHEKANENPDLRSGLALARNPPSWYGPSALVKKFSGLQMGISKKLFTMKMG
jgi:hypothetical protein